MLLLPCNRQYDEGKDSEKLLSFGLTNIWVCGSECHLLPRQLVTLNGVGHNSRVQHTKGVTV